MVLPRPTNSVYPPPSPPRQDSTFVGRRINAIRWGAVPQSGPSSSAKAFRPPKNRASSPLSRSNGAILIRRTIGLSQPRGKPDSAVLPLRRTFGDEGIQAFVLVPRLDGG